MKNCAIIIGVSEYKYAGYSPLPACSNDAELMFNLLTATQKYEILKIDGKASKHDVIKQIESFLLEDEKKESFGEILFYFSGHGEQNHDIYFVLSETDPVQINSTSLKNSEVDNIVRRASPKLFVKIIDSCQSGMSYIKAAQNNQQIFKDRTSDSKKSFENCIFLCSSKRDEFSYASPKYSFFTKAIIDSIAKSKQKIIKYMDIQNYLTDVFQELRSDQTPYFNTQIDGTEIFCERSETIMTFVAKYYTDDEMFKDSKIEHTDKIYAFLNAYKSESEVSSIMKNLKNVMDASQNKFNSWLKKFYDLTFEFKDSQISSRYEKEKTIAKILYQKRNSENLYVSVKIEPDVKGKFFELIPKELLTVVSFSSSVHSLPSFYAYSFHGKKEGLPLYEIPFVFIYSDTYLYVFTCVKQYLLKGWRIYEEGNSSNYTYKKINYCDFTDEYWDSFLTNKLITSIEFIENSILSFVS